MIKKLKNQKGFTLVELAVVVLIIGVLAAIGIPKYKAAIERSKAAEAFTYFSAYSSAQAQFFTKYSSYATNLQITDNYSDSLPILKYFNAVNDQAAPNATSWSSQVQRNSIGYTVIFNQNGYDNVSSTLADNTNKIYEPVTYK